MKKDIFLGPTNEEEFSSSEPTAEDPSGDTTDTENALRRKEIIETRAIVKRLEEILTDFEKQIEKALGDIKKYTEDNKPLELNPAADWQFYVRQIAEIIRKENGDQFGEAWELIRSIDTLSDSIKWTKQKLEAYKRLQQNLEQLDDLHTKRGGLAYQIEQIKQGGYISDRYLDEQFAQNAEATIKEQESSEEDDSKKPS